MANSCIFASGAEEAQAASYLTLFRSLGTDATGTLNALTLANGPAGSIAANVLTLGLDTTYTYGHADWWDGVHTTRFKWVTGGAFDFFIHVNNGALPRSQYPVNAVMAKLDLSTFQLWKTLNGAFVNLVNFNFAPVNGTFYWSRITAVGTLYTASLYNDSAGAIGTLIGSMSFTIPEPILQSGFDAIQGQSATGIQVGGAFANVLTVTGPAPSGWSVAQGTGEPAWCWSKSFTRIGLGSFSIYNAHSTAQAWWQSPNLATLAGISYTITAQLWGLAGSAPANFYPNINFSGVPPNNPAPTDSAWHLFTYAMTPGATQPIELIAYGTGLYYFDDIAVYPGTPSYASPVFSVPSDARYGKRQVLKFGGLTVPVIGGTQSYIDIMDGANWFLDSKQAGIDIKIDRRLVSSPYVWRAKSVLQSEDWYPCIVTIPILYDESNGNTFQAARAALFGAGSQYLTFDNLTGMVARLNSIQNLRMRVSSQPYLWEGQLQFVGYEPWWKDFAASTTDAKVLSGSTSPTATYFGIMQLGSIWTEPVFTLTIPSTNTVPISQFVLLNSTSGEQLTISFGPALAANTLWVLTIDCGAMTVTDQNGKQYDFTGSFPLLYGPAQTVNTFAATLVTSSGTSTGVTLAASWTSRWIP